MAITMQIQADAAINHMELEASGVPVDGSVRQTEVYGTSVFVKTTHVGRVVSTFERNWHDDSDFYALVWDDAKNAPVEIMYATTRGWTYANGASVDATPEIAAKYAAWLAARAAEAAELRANNAAIEAAVEAKSPRKGRKVTIVRGRKLPKGLTGVVVWEGTDRWNKARIGIKDADGNVHFTAASNAEVTAAA